MVEDLSLNADELQCAWLPITKTMIGQTVSLKLNCTNRADKQLTVNGIVRINSHYYNGIEGHAILHKKWTQPVAPKSNGTVIKFEVPAKDYLPKLVEHSLIKTFAMLSVSETNQVWADDQDIQLDKVSARPQRSTLTRCKCLAATHSERSCNSEARPAFQFDRDLPQPAGRQVDELLSVRAKPHNVFRGERSGC